MFAKDTADIERLSQTIAEAENDLRSLDAGSKEYAEALAHLERLYKLKEKHSPKRVDPNTWLLVGGNLAGIIIIVAWEHGHVVTSRAIGMIGKGLR